MKWIKIEEGCEMPEIGEVVVVMNIYSWREAEYYGRADDEAFIYSSGQFVSIDEVTHWARVELPEE